MNITIDHDDSQEMLEYYRMKVEVVEKDVNKSIAKLKRYQAIVDQLEGNDIDDTAEVDEQGTEADEPNEEPQIPQQEPDQAVPKRNLGGVKPGTKRGNYKDRQPKNKIAGNVDEAASLFNKRDKHKPNRRYEKKNRVESVPAAGEVKEVKKFERPPAVYSNSKSLYSDERSK